MAIEIIHDSIPEKPSYQFKNLLGQEFGRLTVVRYVKNKNSKGHKWECVCSCGNVSLVSPCSLIRGDTQSCGCIARSNAASRLFQHGESRSITYSSWRAMINRSSNENNPSYKRYGGAGIFVCERWENSYLDFLEDMGERPSKEYSIDRIDNKDGYYPENCRWASKIEQANNKNRTRNVCVNGVTKSVSQWARDIGVKPGFLFNYVYRGMSVEDAIKSKLIDAAMAKGE